MRLAELEVSATAEFVSVARLVVSAIADDRYDLTNDRLDNLKLAVSEACSLAIDSKSGNGIVVTCDGTDERFDVVIDGKGHDFRLPSVQSRGLEIDGNQLDTQLGLPFIETLVDELEVRDASAGNAVRLTMFCRLADDF
jgi:anti-sigma regulatory factor (Ser/Thr protein kinase)